MPWVPRPPPTPERRREHDQEHAVGGFLKAMHDAEKPEKNKPQKPKRTTVWLSKSERWKKRKKGGVRPEGFDFRDVWRASETSRNKHGKPGGGRFAKRPEHGERAKQMKLPEKEDEWW